MEHNLDLPKYRILEFPLGVLETQAETAMNELYAQGYKLVGQPQLGTTSTTKTALYVVTMERDS